MHIGIYDNGNKYALVNMALAKILLTFVLDTV